jgi:hypothetical protein
MRNKSGNNNNGVNRLIGHLAAEKKKVVMAVCLVVLMAFMWVRVFFRKTTTAEANASAEQVNQESGSKPALKISYIELPKVAGRNDVITRDIFTSDNWRNFNGKGKNIVSIEEVNVVPGDGREEVIRKVVENIKLEAIVVGDNAKAFINNKVHSVGDKLLIKDGVNEYECEVVAIEENAVVISCSEAEVKLKLRRVYGSSE